MFKTKKEKEYSKLIKKDKYQTFILTCPAMIPACFAIHPWIVLNEKGKLSRYEVRYYKNNKKSHLHINELRLFQGIRKVFFLNFFWKSKIININEGDLAKKIIDYVKKTETHYPFQNKYNLLGPNSNTYIQQIINNFPELNLKLSWRAIGKNYKKK